MQETERQRIERLLREQLARFEQREAAENAPHGFLGGLIGRTVAGRRIQASVSALRGRLPRFPARRKAVLATVPRKDFDALRGERAFDDLHAAVVSDPPPVMSRDSGGPGTAWRRGPVPSLDHGDLPNGSGGGARVAAMRETPARDWGSPPKVQFPRPDSKKDRRSDLVVAALGVALGLTCALFPWYIFFNQEQFGVQAISFGGRGHNAGRIMVDPKPGEDVTDVAKQEISRNLDLFSTGTVQPQAETPQDAPGLDQQPFPSDAARFSLVHVANGRAMIEDDAGLWIVQQGSTLPDSTRVKSIEKRKGRWVLVTSADRVIEISK